MRRGATSLGPPALALVSALGCSLTAIDPTPCEASVQCRSAFGLGSTCGDDGYCLPPAEHPRCRQSWPPDLQQLPELYASHIVLGSMFAYGDHADSLRAVELAVRQLALQGGLDGREFAVLHCDTTAMAGDALDDVAASEAVARHLADVVGVPAIIGPRGSARTQAAFEAIADRGVLMISPSSTSPALAALDPPNPSFEHPGLLWRTVPPDDLQSSVIADDMRGRGVVHVVAIYQEGAYGEGLVDLFAQRFAAAGGAEVAREPFRDGQVATIVAGVGARLAAGELDEVLFVSSDIADYVAFFDAAVASENLVAAYTRDGVGLFLPDAAYAAALLEQTSSGAEMLFPKVRGTRPAPAEGVVFDAFAAAYSATYQAPADASGFTANSYDAAWLVAYGTAWSHHDTGTITGVGIARGLRRVSSGPAIDIVPDSWPTVVADFAAGRAIDVTGASGPLDYDPDTEETLAPISIWAIVPDAAADTGWAFEELARIDPG